MEAIVNLESGSSCVPEPIVRCRDCIAYSLLVDPYGEQPDCAWCELLEAKTEPDGYCHRGVVRRK